MIYNKAHSLSDALQHPTQITELYLHDQPFSDWPAAIFQLSQLRKLEITNCKLKEIPEQISQLKQLEVLNISGNRLKSLPTTFFSMTALRKLNLSRNRISEFPSVLTFLPNLQKLNLSRNRIETISEDVGHLKQLKTLDLSTNRITTLPETIGQCEELISLFLHKNQLTSLPDSMRSLRRLTTCTLNNNELTILSEHFTKCTELKELDISNNDLRSLPRGFGQLRQLKKLYLKSNDLQSLPHSFGDLRTLTFLDLRRNSELSYSPVLLWLLSLKTLLLPSSLKAYKGIPTFLKKCSKAALPEDWYALFYQLSLQEAAIIRKLSLPQLLAALRFPDAPVQTWAKARLLSDYSKAFIDFPMKEGSEIALLGRFDSSMRELKTQLKEVGINYSRKVKSETTHLILGMGAYLKEEMFDVPRVLLSEEMLCDRLGRKKSSKKIKDQPNSQLDLKY